MTKRLKNLARIEAVQAKLVALADLRLAQARTACRDIVEDQGRLREFIGRTDALSPRLAKAALRAGYALDEKLVQREAEREACRSRRDVLKRRQHAVASMVRAETVTARREAEDRERHETMEAWLGRATASLP